MSIIVAIVFSIKNVARKAGVDLKCINRIYLAFDR
jgi:hypothetical protein